MRPAAFLIIAAAAATCASSAVSEPRTAKAEAELAKALAGKVAGAPVHCLPPQRTNGMTIIDDNTILFRRNSNLLYRNDPPGGCSPLSRGRFALVTKTPGSSLCQGDIAQIVDTVSRLPAGACALGEFVPYRTVRH
ncbi:MAG TPA: hypothetical protein VK485_03465 [Sphingomicrobium sp.]|nr:hypothetical protein [Sphingomicrobium sp.]